MTELELLELKHRLENLELFIKYMKAMIYELEIEEERQNDN